VDTQLTPEELMLAEAARAFLESRIPSARRRELSATPSGFDAEFWREAGKLGWLALLAPEDCGGVGGDGVVAAAIVAEELGRALHSGPFLAVSVVIDALAREGSEEQRQVRVPSLVDGSAFAAWAIADGPGCWDAASVRTTATSRGDGVVLVGTKRWVQDGQNASHLLVTCRDDGGDVTQVLVPADAPGVTITSLETMDLGRRLADVRLEEVVVGSDGIVGAGGSAAAAVLRQLQLATVLQCAETVGATARVLEETVEYAKERIAFGRPIGSFQIIKHYLAEAATVVEAAQAATWAAVRCVAGELEDADRAVHVAKAFVGARCPHIVEECMQVMGGIAMTWEHDAHLFLRRVQSNRLLFGAPAWHADRLCDLVGVAR
jgi:alkylation response protein AidB-like acyl-CoA dehydrogenase